MEFRIYAICFGVGLAFTLFSALFGHLFGGGHEAHVDVGHAHGGDHSCGDSDQGGMPDLSPCSPTILASFVTAAGGLGMIFSRIDIMRPLWISLPLSVLGGLVVAAVVFFLFNAVFSQVQGSSESRVATLIGQSATIITPIPEGGVGEIAYVQAGTRYTAPARSSQDQPVDRGKTVYIVRIVGAEFFVATV